MLQVVYIEPTYQRTDPWVQGNLETENLKWPHHAHLLRMNYKKDTGILGAVLTLWYDSSANSWTSV